MKKLSTITVKIIKSIWSFITKLLKNIGPLLLVIIFGGLLLGGYYVYNLLLSGNDFTQKLPVPSKNWESNIANHLVATSSFETSKVVVGSEQAKLALRDLVEKNRNEFEYTLTKKVKEAVSRRQDEADKLFSDVCEKVPGFVKNHIEEIGEKEVIVDSMQRELFSQDTLDNYLMATAIELDRSLFQTVNEYLAGELKELQLKNASATYEELKAMLPDAREVCEDIYARFNNHMLNQPQLSNLNRLVHEFAERQNFKQEQENNKSRITKGAIECTIGVILLSVVQCVPGIGQALGIGLSIAGGIVTAWGVSDTTTGIVGEAVTKIEKAAVDTAEAIYETKLQIYIKNLKKSVLETRDVFKRSIGCAALKILEAYKKIPDSLLGANIEVDTNMTPNAQEFGN